MSNTAVAGVVLTTQVRTLVETDGQAVIAGIQTEFIRRTQALHSELRSELALRLKTTGFSVADQATASGTIMTAVQAVAW